MVSRYEEHPQASGVDDVESRGKTSPENLCERHPELNGLAEMDDEQKIEVFRGLLEALHRDLDGSQHS